MMARLGTTLSPPDWRVALGLVLLALVAAWTPTELRAQVGDISDVNYPGWIPSDRVDPYIHIATPFDTATQRWTYDFTLGNGADASQDILAFQLQFAVPAAGALTSSSPSGWRQLMFSARGAIPGAIFRANQSAPATENPPPPSAAQIPPNDSLSGFTVESEYPPGYARAYVQGYAGYPEAEDLGYDDYTVPHDTTNSQRRWTLAPTLYPEVLTTGDETEPTDGFLGYMSLRATGSVLLDPAPVALELAVNGETVFPETLLVTLNGVDVTDGFHPGPADGADLVAVFRLGSSPLQEGTNVLITNIQGEIPGTSQTGTDTDAIEFTVDPDAGQPSEIPF